jgi:peptidoglycan hydrolase-like protein with peptidoglycan-binding domain
MEALKKKFNAIALFFKTREVSEQAAIISTILVFILILTTFFLVVTFVLPKTEIEVSISGPETAKIGEEIIYTVTYKNTGNVILKNPELVFHYPSFSLPEKSLIETRRLEEDLFPDQTKTFTFKAQLFGKENETREIKTWINYSTEKKPSLVMSEIAYFSTTISEVPIDLILDIPQKIPVSAKEEPDFTFRIRYFSSAELPIAGLKLLVEFPSGFTFKGSIPEKSSGQELKSEFEIPTLEHSGKGELEIIGSFPNIRKIGEELDFNVKLLINLHGTDILLKKDSASAVTYEPNFIFSQKINNQEKYFPYMGEKLHYEIHFKNITDEPLRNLTLTTILEGNFFNLSTLETSLGSFSQGGNSISWDGEKIPLLRYLTPGEEGKVEFWVNLKNDYQPKDLTETNASIKNRVILAGFETEFRIRVNSLIKVSQEAYFKDIYGFFENPGQHPPRVNEATHYTIVWKLQNYFNWIENAIVKASLPSGVSFRSVKTTHGEVTVSTDLERRSPYPEIPTSFRFEKPLYQGLTNNDIAYLQIILKSEVPRNYPQNIPASGYFGAVTLEALKKFQEKYTKEILEPQGITQATGYVDELTRTKLNGFLAKGAPGPSEVIWKIDNINPGKGIFEDPLIAAFQIAFVPEMSQKGQITNLINEVTFSAKDQWTEMLLSANDKAIDTTLSDDLTARGIGEIR